VEVGLLQLGQDEVDVHVEQGLVAREQVDLMNMDGVVEAGGFREDGAVGLQRGM
jgi:hypothetical protein